MSSAPGHKSEYNKNDVRESDMPARTGCRCLSTYDFPAGDSFSVASEVTSRRRKRDFKAAKQRLVIIYSVQLVSAEKGR